VAKFDQGDNFISEKTGSATMINVDRKWEHDFTDDQATAAVKNMKSTKADKKRPDVIIKP